MSSCADFPAKLEEGLLEFFDLLSVLLGCFSFLFQFYMVVEYMLVSKG
jgi:hypothetical protein